ncbi:class I glutamine amidotransferase-like protein [Pisolithus croceorrhizus]|nr:class I glutamine amidotransferase-like protein [Pisolithus croceorrhizus]
MSSTRKVLFVFTSTNQTLTGKDTGWYLPEAAHPYYVLSPHFDVDFAAPKGPNPPVDPASTELFKDDLRFLDDQTVMSKLANAKKLSDVEADDYAAIFYVGGHGPVIDLPVDPINVKLASDFYRAGKVVSCRLPWTGVGALVNVTDASGKSIFTGRHATAFSNAEEEQVGKVKDVPFLVEDRIKSLGGIYEAAEPWQAKVVVSGDLITGQNPASAQGIGDAILKNLQE